MYIYQVEQQLLEEEFIAACFEEMWAEEEAQWQYYCMSQQVLGSSYVPMFYTEPTVLQPENKTVLVSMLTHSHTMTHFDAPGKKAF